MMARAGEGVLQDGRVPRVIKDDQARVRQPLCQLQVGRHGDDAVLPARYDERGSCTPHAETPARLAEPAGRRGGAPVMLARLSEVPLSRI